MDRTIIALKGGEKSGKSATIRRTCELLIEKYTYARLSHSLDNFHADILLTVTIGTLTIGFESQGDPYSRVIKDETLEKLIKGKGKYKACDIIVCATRTRGGTTDNIHKLSKDYKFHKIWTKNYTSSTLNHSVLNDLGAKHMLYLVESLMIGIGEL